MEIFLLIVAIILVIFLTRAYNRKSEELTKRLDHLQSEVEHLRKLLRTGSEDLTQTSQTEVPPVIKTDPAPASTEASPKPRATPPPFPSDVQPAPPKLFPPPSQKAPVSPINWERFMGVNLFAWIGGFVLFLAAAFFVKYSIDNNLISPQIRIALGVLLAFALLVTGLRLSLKQYRVSAQTLCSTGILILYVDVFASHVFYHFIGITTAFFLMILVTSVAFFLAVRLDAKVVAILGLLGGFLTPPLLSTGVDNPLGLFSYVFILDAGLIAIALRKKWRFLILFAAIGTVLMQIGWVTEFFKVEKAQTAWNIFAAFIALFVITLFAAKKLQQIDDWISVSVLLIPFVTVGFCFYLLGFSALGENPKTIFSFCLLAEAGLIAAVLLRPALHAAHVIAGVLIFFLLSIWNSIFLEIQLLNWGLGLSLAFAVAHSFFPVIFQRMYPESGLTRWVHVFPIMAMVLLLLIPFKFTEFSLSVWFIVLMVDAIAVCLAIVSASRLSLIGVLLLTLFAIWAWLSKAPVATFELSDGLLLIGGYAIFFAAAGIFYGRKMLSSAESGDSRVPNQLVDVPALSAVLPFLLLMLVVVRLPLKDPTPVFGLALLLVALILGIWRWLKFDLLTLVALLCCAMLEYTWQVNRFDPVNPFVTLIWYFLFFAIFAVLPFLFQKGLRQRKIPWFVAALSGPLHFYLFYDVILRAYPNSFMGLLPAVLAMVPLLSVFQRLRVLQPDEEGRTSQLSYFGAATLFFVTLIFPIQFEREWVTIGWALEGAALLWLFHKVPHQGLRWLGCSLLSIAFLRLTIDPSVVAYYERSTTKILNWYLYTYGIVTACLLFGAGLEATVKGRNMRTLLYVLGTLLAFVLVNIEIADYFSEGKHLQFEFSGNFARDMTYSIAWALFAFVLLIVGINKKVKPARYAAMGLIGITLLKLFLHDLNNLKHLYRVGALVAVASVLILASYLYQRYVSFEPRESS